MAARLAFRQNGRGLKASRVARKLTWSAGQAERALAALREVGYLEEMRHAVNFSGLPEYRLARA
jgi:DNA-binding IclR family transcriptional regulator